MKQEIFTFYRAADPMKGSWDGYGIFPAGDNDFIAFVADAPSGASIHTPELIKEFWTGFSTNHDSGDLPGIVLADALNRLQDTLLSRSRRDNSIYQATIAVARKIGDTLYYCSIGDSVLQLYRKGKLYRLSESEVWDSRLITTSDYESRERQKTDEIRFIGSNGSFIRGSEISSIRLQDDDLLLFYSDGVEDLLPPDQLCKVLAASPKDLRAMVENIFSQSKVKDDTTILCVPVSVSSAYDARKEIRSLSEQLTNLQKEQSGLRSRLDEISSSRVRLERIEASLAQMAADVQRLGRRSVPTQSRIQQARGVHVANHQLLYWLIPLLTLIIGTVAGAYLFRTETPEPPRAEQRSRTPVRAITPPEIPTESGTCSYTIQKGDTLQKIAEERNLSLDQLLLWNPAYTKETPLVIGKSIQLCGETP